MVDGQGSSTFENAVVQGPGKATCYIVEGQGIATFEKVGTLCSNMHLPCSPKPFDSNLRSIGVGTNCVSNCLKPYLCLARWLARVGPQNSPQT